MFDALEGNVKAEKAVRDLRAEELNKTDGMNILLNKLDVVFKSETVDEVYVYSKFITFQKHSEMTMTDNDWLCCRIWTFILCNGWTWYVIAW